MRLDGGIYGDGALERGQIIKMGLSDGCREKFSSIAADTDLQFAPNLRLLGKCRIKIAAPSFKIM